jgi:hypothetical protein
VALLALESVASRWSAAMSADISATAIGAAVPSHQFADVMAELRSSAPPPLAMAPAAVRDGGGNSGRPLFSVAPSVLGETDTQHPHYAHFL